MPEEVKNGRRETLMELGAMIKARREHLGLSLEEVQEKTKIRLKYLRAIEEGNDKVAPGEGYFRVFLKTYADFLGLDGVEFARAYREITEGASRPRPSASAAQDVPGNGQSRPRRRTRRRKGMGALSKTLLTLVLLAGVIFAVTKLYGIYSSRSEQPGDVSGPENGTEVGDLGPDPGEEDPREQPAPEVVIRREDPSEDITVFTVNQTPFTVVLRTLSQEGSRCWVRVQADGEVITEDTMGPGQTLEIVAETEIRVRAGAPWVLTLTLNGQDLGEGGPYGPVKDLVFRYDPEL